MFSGRGSIHNECGLGMSQHMLGHLVRSLKNQVLSGCRLAHSLEDCSGQEPSPQITACRMRSLLLFAEVQLWTSLLIWIVDSLDK